MTTTRRLRTRQAAWAAWGVWGLWLALSTTALVLALWRPGVSDEAVLGFLLVGYATTGALIASRHPRNAVGWVLLAVAVAFGLQALAETYLWTGLDAGRSGVGWVVGWVWFVWIVVLGVFLPLVFPTGRLLSPRWRWVAWTGLVSLLLYLLGVGLRPGPIDVEARPPVDNPIGVTALPAEFFETVEDVGTLLFVAAVVCAVAALPLRLGRAHGVERQQLKWFTLVGVLTLTGLVVAGLAELLLPPGPARLAGSMAWTTFLVGSLVGIPLAVAVAVFRHRLYDIDRVINKTLVYGSLTAALLATYIACVLVLGRILNPLTGDSALAVAASTLAVAALFRPARRGIQRTVDRRFYRHRYDASRILEDFTTRLRHELDLDAVSNDLRSAVDETLQPTHVTLWLRR
jgi:hypothetical protein